MSGGYGAVRATVDLSAEELYWLNRLALCGTLGPVALLAMAAMPRRTLGIAASVTVVLVPWWCVLHGSVAATLQQPRVNMHIDGE
jgi:hypothetical protein